jgi:3-hydroxy acid dehydrogenase / malonic semialdehyde reductase
VGPPSSAGAGHPSPGPRGGRRRRRRAPAGRRVASVPPVGALDGQTAIVTGASSGIGAATAAAFAREGARVIGGARRLERLQTEVALPLDVTDPESCERFVAAAGPCDILLNAAGLALGRAPFDESSEEDERTVLETNVNGLMRMTRLVLKRSLREPGHIINIGSVAGHWAYPNGASYVAAKSAVRGFTRALREDLLGRDIRVTAVDAGLVETEFSVVRFRGDEDAARAVYEGTRPLSAQDVSDCILFAVTRPPYMVVDEMLVMSIDQSSGARINRRTG